MTDKDQNTTNAELIDEQTTFTLAELCRHCAVEAEYIEAMIEHGILEPVSAQRPHYTFAAASLRRTRVTVRLQRDLGVNLPGAALALDLLERIAELDAQLERSRPPETR
jgi:chaperone modulatory protein CbpM